MGGSGVLVIECTRYRGTFKDPNISIITITITINNIFLFTFFMYIWMILQWYFLFLRRKEIGALFIQVHDVLVILILILKFQPWKIATYFLTETSTYFIKWLSSIFLSSTHDTKESVSIISFCIFHKIR